MATKILFMLPQETFDFDHERPSLDSPRHTESSPTLPQPVRRQVRATVGGVASSPRLFTWGALSYFFSTPPAMGSVPPLSLSTHVSRRWVTLSR